MSCQGTVSPKGARKLHDADVVYLYDGSFEGFLCCVYESFAQHELPFAVWTPQRETATLYPVKDIGRRTRSCFCSGFCIWPLRWVRAQSNGRGIRWSRPSTP